MLILFRTTKRYPGGYDVMGNRLRCYDHAGWRVHYDPPAPPPYENPPQYRPPPEPESLLPPPYEEGPSQFEEPN